MLLHALIVDCVHLSTSMEKNKSENYSRSIIGGSSWDTFWHTCKGLRELHLLSWLIEFIVNNKFFTWMIALLTSSGQETSEQKELEYFVSCIPTLPLGWLNDNATFFSAPIYLNN